LCGQCRTPHRTNAAPKHRAKLKRRPPLWVRSWVTPLCSVHASQCLRRLGGVGEGYRVQSIVSYPREGTELQCSRSPCDDPETAYLIFNQCLYLPSLKSALIAYLDLSSAHLDIPLTLPKNRCIIPSDSLIK